MLIFCISHLVAAEYVSIQPSRGEVLLFKRDNTRKKIRGRDVEASVTGFDPNDSTRQPNEHAGLHSELQSRPRFKISRRPAVVHWEALGFDISTREGKKTILKGVDGWIKPGTLTALMVRCLSRIVDGKLGKLTK
jgi:ATP-binding cassette, subfamily G (WHITE), member 2, PDR